MRGLLLLFQHHKVKDEIVKGPQLRELILSDNQLMKPNQN